MKKEVAFVGLFLIIFLISLCSGDFGIGKGYSITQDYGPSGEISGWVNISFSEEPMDSLFKDSFNNKIKLKNVLENNYAYDYVCNTNDCESDFELNNPENETTFSLEENESAIFAMQVNGKITEIESIEFEIISDAAESCEDQLKIDFFVDDVYDFGNNQISETACEEFEKNYSCYEIGEAIETAWIDNQAYCQKVTLPEAPGFQVGAWIKKTSAKSPDLLMKLFEIGKSTPIEECDLLVEPGEEGEFNCTLEFLVTEEEEYYLCVYADTTEEIYQTKSNSNPEEECGFYGPPELSNTMNTAYYIFFQPLKFDSFEEILVEDEFANGDEIIEEIEDYLDEKYSGMNCSLGCAIPVKFTSFTDQEITLKNLRLIYKSDTGKKETNYFYEAEETAAKVSSDFQKLYLDNSGFFVPTTIKDYSYKLRFEGEEIFQDSITVGNVPIVTGIIPLKTAQGYSTKFKATVQENGNIISKYTWNFDGVKKTSSTNEIFYTFTNAGTHNLTISVEDNSGKSSSKKFIINVDTPEARIQSDINNLKESLEKIKQELLTFNLFEKSTLEEYLDLTNAEADINALEEAFGAADSEQEYLDLLDDLFLIDLPETLVVKESADSIVFFPKEEKIDLDYLSSTTGENYDNSKINEYISAIFGWNQQNMETKISYKKIKSIKNFNEEHFLTFFEIDTKEKIILDESPYLIIEKMSDLNFKENYGEEDLINSYSIILDSDKEIIFSTTEEIEFTDLAIFISPKLKNLNVKIASCSTDADCLDGQICDEGFCLEKGISKWTFFVLGIILLLIGAFIFYVILFQWYKNKYEDHLFKNRNNLFNLLNYINHQKRKGELDKDIVKKLKKAKWRTEQIDYAIKKFYGKNTGMFEIPFLKLIFSKKNKIVLNPNNRVNKFTPRRFGPRKM